MSLRRKVTGALAWAGLVIVIAVPAAEAIRSRLVTDRIDLPGDTVATIAPAPQAATTRATGTAGTAAPPAPRPAVASRPAPAATDVPPAVGVSDAAPVAARASDALDAYLASGKSLPDYIKPGPARQAPPAAAAQAREDAGRDASPPAAAVDGAPPAGAPSGAAAPVAVASAPAAAPPGDPPVPLPAVARPRPEPPRIVTESELDGWRSGTLEDYLRQQGLLSAGDQQSSGM